MSDTIFATVYAALAALPFALQLAVAAGAPLGRFTVGGRFPGRLPGAWRALALVQAALLAAMALVVLSTAGVIGIALPGWTIWPVLGLTLLTNFANLVTPSRPERLVWGPVTVAMSLCLIGLIAL
ncbi:MAG: hypothetical protein KDK53_09505 [Maritimibacter sp.]|nr:hypothetical protein [Maritimibacter sp.]